MPKAAACTPVASSTWRLTVAVHCGTGVGVPPALGHTMEMVTGFGVKLTLRGTAVGVAVCATALWLGPAINKSNHVSDESVSRIDARVNRNSTPPPLSFIALSVLPDVAEKSSGNTPPSARMCHLRGQM